MKFKDFLNESALKDIQKEDKIFIMIIGGVASGKSYIYEKNFSKIKLVDVDEYVKKLSGGDWEKARKLVSKGVMAAKADLLKSFKDNKSVVHMGIGGSIKQTTNKFLWAKEKGFKTAIVLVDVSLDKALERNQSRADKGERNLIPDYKVQRSNTTSRENYKVYKKITDYSIIIKN